MFKSRYSSPAIAVAFLSLANACTEQVILPTSARPPNASRAIATSSSLWAQELTGVTADGAAYGIFVPNGWTGDVVYYAHGIIAPLLPVSLPGPTEWDNAGSIREAFGPAGFAIA